MAHMLQWVSIRGPSGDGMQEWQCPGAADLHTVFEHASFNPLRQGFVHVGVRYVDRRRFTISQLVHDSLDLDLRVCVEGVLARHRSHFLQEIGKLIVKSLKGRREGLLKVCEASRPLAAAQPSAQRLG